MEGFGGKNMENLFKDVDKKSLSDIAALEPKTEMKLQEKVEEFIINSGSQPYVHRNEGYTVVVKMSGEIDATDAICDYLRKRVELRY